jgi:hypothetical protein
MIQNESQCNDYIVKRQCGQTCWLLSVVLKMLTTSRKEGRLCDKEQKGLEKRGSCQLILQDTRNI